MEFANGTKWSSHLRTPSILPSNVHQVQNLIHEITCILIVEKEAVFNNMLHHISHSEQKHMLIVTGKGFPSHSLIHLLGKFPKARFMIMVDWDPYGMEIAFCYQQHLNRAIEHVAASWDHVLLNGWLQTKTLELSFQDRKKIKSLFQRMHTSSSLFRQAEYMLHFNAKLELDVIDPEVLSNELQKKMAK